MFMFEYSKKKKCKKAKWLSEEGLQITMKRREVKSKGEKERYKHLNASKVGKKSVVEMKVTQLCPNL